MPSIPKTAQRDAQPYAFVRFTVPMSDMKKPADEGFPLLFGYLAEQGIAPISAPFYNYRRIDMATTLDVEAGVPVERKGTDSDRVRFGELPGGTYVEMVHTGHFDGLYDATAMLIGWAKEQGIKWAVREAADGDHFACRLEIYETDPSEEPDHTKWVTRLAFKTAD